MQLLCHHHQFVAPAAQTHYSFWHELLRCMAFSSQLLWGLAGELTAQAFLTREIRICRVQLPALMQRQIVLGCSPVIKESLTQQCSITAVLTGLSLCHEVSWQPPQSSQSSQLLPASTQPSSPPASPTTSASLKIQLSLSGVFSLHHLSLLCAEACTTPSVLLLFPFKYSRDPHL